MKSLSPMFAGSFGLAVKRNGSRLAVLLAAFFVLFAAQALAQEATIVGTVTDPSGAAVANAKVTLTNLDTNLSKNLTTNESGQYTAVDIHIGRYNIKVETSGFKSAERKDLVLQVGDRARADFQLAVGGSSETVTVEANAIAVQSDSGEVSNVITGEQIANLSINGRGIYQLAALAPGASSQIDVTAPNTPVGWASAGVEYNGLRQNHNIYLLDGGEDDDRGGAGGMSIAPSADAIAEFRTLTSNYSADYGLSSAGTNVLVLKSGTKSYHAAAWEFNRNDAFDARTYNNNGSKAELRQNTFGFNAGGPVDVWRKEHKTFFFYNMEWRKYIDGATLQQTVPYTDWYTGNYTNHLPADVKLDPTFDPTTPPIPNSGLHTPCSNQVSSAIATQIQSAGLQLSTPDAGGGCSPNTKATIANNPQFKPLTIGGQVPTAGLGALWSANAQALLTVSGAKYGGIFPAPNSGQNFIGGNNSPTNLREEIVRIDHQFNSKFSVFGHFVDESVQQQFGTSLWNWSNTPAQGTSFGNPSYSAVVHTTYAISPTLLNEVAFNYNGNRINITPTGLVSAPSGFTFSRIFSGPNSDNRIPNIHLAGSTGTQFGNNSWPWTNKADDYQIRDDISLTKGAHQFKFGGNWAIYKKYQQLFGNTQGDFTFNGNYTGLDFADYTLGLSSGYGELGVQDYGKWNNVSWAFYGQDNWRVNKRLTLNLGLRWDGVPHTYEANNRMGNFYPNLYDPANAALLDTNGNICSANDVAAGDPKCPTISPGLGTSPNPILAGSQFYLNGIGIPGKTAGVPKGLVNTNWAAFGPRLGFAYDLTGSGKTILRGGFGVMYERIQGNDMYNAGPNIPFSTNVNFSNVSLDNPEKFTLTGQQAIAPITVASITGLSVNQYKLPVAYQYSVGVQHQFAPRTVLAVMYVGNQSRQQNYYQDMNVPDASNLPGLINGTINGGYNAVARYQGFGSIKMSTDGANAHYNGLQVDLNSQIKRDLSLRVFYTLSRSYDSSNQTNGGGGGGDLVPVSNPYEGWRYDWGPSGYDRLNNLSFNFIYDVPFLRHASNQVLRTVAGGWELSGIVGIESGLPLNVTLTGAQGGNGVGGNNRPDKTGAIVTPHSKQQWVGEVINGTVTATGFGNPTIGAWGNFPYDGIRGPGRDNWNVSVFKNFVFSEARGSQFELRLETFNTFNHPQISGVPTGVGSTNFGQPNGFFPGRIVQLGGKITF